MLKRTEGIWGLVWILWSLSCLASNKHHSHVEHSVEMFPLLLCFNSVEMKSASCHCQTHSGRFDEQARRKHCRFPGIAVIIGTICVQTFSFNSQFWYSELLCLSQCTHYGTVPHKESHMGIPTHMNTEECPCEHNTDLESGPPWVLHFIASWKFNINILLDIKFNFYWINKVTLLRIHFVQCHKKNCLSNIIAIRTSHNINCMR